MVLSQKTITIPSWSKIDHRYGLSRPADYPYWLQHIQYTLLTKMTTTSAAPSQSKISDLDEKWERSAVSGDVAVAPPAPGGGILTSRPHQLKPTKSNNRHQLKPTDTNSNQLKPTPTNSNQMTSTQTKSNRLQPNPTN